MVAVFHDRTIYRKTHNEYTIGGSVSGIYVRVGGRVLTSAPPKARGELNRRTILATPKLEFDTLLPMATLVLRYNLQSLVSNPLLQAPSRDPRAQISGRFQHSFSLLTGHGHYSTISNHANIGAQHWYRKMLLISQNGLRLGFLTSQYEKFSWQKLKSILNHPKQFKEVEDIDISLFESCVVDANNIYCNHVSTVSTSLLTCIYSVSDTSWSNTTTCIATYVLLFQSRIIKP